MLGLHERFAKAVGGSRAASALLAAADLAEAELGEPARSLELKQEAARLDPTNVDAVEQSVALHVEDGRWDEVVKLKRRLVELARFEAIGHEDAERVPHHVEVDAGQSGKATEQTDRSAESDDGGGRVQGWKRGTRDEGRDTTTNAGAARTPGDIRSARARAG